MADPQIITWTISGTALAAGLTGLGIALKNYINSRIPGAKITHWHISDVFVHVKLRITGADIHEIHSGLEIHSEGARIPQFIPFVAPKNSPHKYPLKYGQIVSLWTMDDEVEKWVAYASGRVGNITKVEIKIRLNDEREYRIKGKTMVEDTKRFLLEVTRKGAAAPPKPKD